MSISESDLISGRAGEVCFDNVSFLYQGNEQGESGGLKHISFRVAPGKMVAFVGASGMCYRSFPPFPWATICLIFLISTNFLIRYSNNNV